jgi:ribosome-binding factor A
MDPDKIKKERHINRSEDAIRNKLGELLLHEIRDPRIPILTSVTKVVLSQELGTAQIFVAIPPTNEDYSVLLQILEKSSTYLRKRLSDTLNMKKTPKLTFVIDHGLEVENRLDSMLRNLD